HQPRQGRQQTGEPEAVPGPHVALDDGAFRGRPECSRCGGLNPEYKGFGTGLKPGHEPVVVARKPMATTVAANVLEHGVGGLNIDACRVHSEDAPEGRTRHGGGIPGNGSSYELPDVRPASPAGRFPANVLLDEHAAKEMDKQSGWSPSNARQWKSVEGERDDPSGFLGTLKGTGAGHGHNDSGGASRFFQVFKYQAKAPKKERPVIIREDGTKVQHPTVKPLKLMEWLVTLITPEGGVVLDPFAGTGTTLQAATNKGFNPIGIEADTDYIQLIRQRMEGGEQSTRNS